MALDKVRIQGIRGIRGELTLDLAGSSLVVRGDNGTGKSSIVAGLLWALRGDEEPIPTAKSGSEEAYRANVLDGAAKAQVSLDIKGGGSIVVKPGAVTADEKGERVRLGCRRSTPFLLRRQLLRFLEDKPINRFKYLESFLDLEEADGIREGVANRAEVHEKAAEQHRRARDGLLRPVLELLPHEHVPAAASWSTMSEALVGWARGVGVLPSGAEANWDDLVGAVARLRHLLEGDKLAQRRSAIVNAQRPWREISSTQPPPDAAPLIERRDALLTEATDAALMTLLEEASRHLSAHPTSERCPVCEQKVDASSVRERLGERIRVLADLKRARHELVSAGLTWRRFWETLSEAIRAGAVVDGMPAPPAAPPGVSELSGIEDATRFAEETVRLGTTIVVAWATSVREQAAAYLEGAASQLPSEDDTSAVRRLVQAVEQADKVRLAVTVAEASAEESASRELALATVHEALRTARQDVAQELLDEISGLVSEFYSVVHPPDAHDEVTGPPEIVVQRRSGGTAHVRGKFNAKPVEDPRFVYSDGHLDTVGICVYLALRRFRATRDGLADPKLMVLDDIVLSVDLGHGRRLLDLLRTRFDDHQVLIFTHNGLFADWCVEKLPTYKRKAIARWTVDTGPQLGEYRSMMDRIEQQVDAETSPKHLAQAVMNLMDEWLAQARFEFELSVRARRGEEYTLTDIWNPFTKRLKELQKNLKAPIGSLTEVLDDLGALVPMRNRLAAHENEFAHEFPLATVRHVAKRCIELVRLLYCPRCPSFALPIPNGDAPDLVRCKPNCEHVRYDRPRKPQASTQTP